MSQLKAYSGSCHCGNVQYQVKFKLPPIHDPTVDSVRIYRCNCTACHKMGYFHCRPTEPTKNYILTSPANPDELGDYRCNNKRIGWYFCKNCGVRIVGLSGSWEQVELDVDRWNGTKADSEGEKLQKVWKPKGESRVVGTGDNQTTRPCYLSLNAVTLEPNEDIDLRNWHDRGWVFYVENLKGDGRPMRVGEPHDGGMY